MADNAMYNNGEAPRSRDSDSDDDNRALKRCKHTKNGVNMNEVEKKVSSMKPSDIQCVTCVKDESSSSTDSDNQPKEDDSSSSENTKIKEIWICLSCGETNCGHNDKGHAEHHYNESNESDNNHPISLSLDSVQAWCYECKSYVTPSITKNQIISQAQASVRKHLKEDDEDEKEEEEEKGSRESFYKQKWQNYDVTAPGLTNLGNTCFFNSVMQVVVGTTLLHDIFAPVNDRYHDPPHVDVAKCITATTKEEVGPLTDAFKDFLREMWSTRDNVVTPRDLFTQISRKWQQFRGWRQQDSQELMRFLFDGVKSEELELIKKLNSQDEDNDEPHEDELENHDDPDKGKKDSNKSTQKHVSFIDSCFGGKLVSVIVCDVCKNCSYSYEEFLDVSLPIKSSSTEKHSEYGGYSSFNSNSFAGGLGGTFDAMDSHDGPGDEDTSKKNEESISDIEIEEGIPIPTKEESERIVLLLRDLPSDSGRSTPNSRDHVTLRECLKNFVKVETLEGDNSFACNNCWKLKEQYNEQKRKAIEEKALIDNDNNTDSSNDDGDTVNNGTIDNSDIDNVTIDNNGTIDNGTTDNNDNIDTVDNGTVDNVAIDNGETVDNGIVVDNGDIVDNSAIDDVDNNTINNVDNSNSIDNDGNNNAIDSGDRSEMDVQTSEVENNTSDMEDIEYNKRIPDADEVKGNSIDTDDDNSPMTNNNGVMDYGDSSSYNSSQYTKINSLTMSTKSEPTPKPGRTYIYRKAYKRYLFDSLPPVMVFHLKRFQQVGSKWSMSMTMRKIDDFVAFDEELDVSDFVVPPEINKKTEESKQRTKYRLYGVVVHLGSLYNGHYIAYVLSSNLRGKGEQYGVPRLSMESMRSVREIEQQNRNQRQWIYCSDTCVRAASIEDVLTTSGAYLLFYERVYG